MMTQVIPCWKNAPSWANYHATNENGDAYYYENKPTVKNNRWVANNGNFLMDVNYTYYCKEWKTSLRKRN